jgi:hypothetical protein
MKNNFLPYILSNRDYYRKVEQIFPKLEMTFSNNDKSYGGLNLWPKFRKSIVSLIADKNKIILLELKQYSLISKEKLNRLL